MPLILVPPLVLHSRTRKTEKADNRQNLLFWGHRYFSILHRLRTPVFPSRAKTALGTSAALHDRDARRTAVENTRFPLIGLFGVHGGWEKLQNIAVSERRKFMAGPACLNDKGGAVRHLCVVQESPRDTLFAHASLDLKVCFTSSSRSILHLWSRS